MLRAGGKGFVSEINVTPFVDVMLVLLVIFMITAPLLTEGVDVNLPETEAVQTDKDVPYGLVVRVMGQVKAAGIDNLGIVAERPDAAPERRPGR